LFEEKQVHDEIYDTREDAIDELTYEGYDDDEHYEFSIEKVEQCVCCFNFVRVR
jgi:hypothetical protein